jgi:hypothetical protein
MKLIHQSLFTKIKKLFGLAKSSRKIQIGLGVSLLFIFLITGSGTAAYLYKQESNTTPQYQLEINAPTLINDTYVLGTTGNLEIKIIGNQSSSVFAQKPVLLVKAFLDNNEVLSTIYTPTENNTDTVAGTVTIHSKDLSEGEHTFKAVLSSEKNNQILEEEVITVVSDQTWPQLTSVTSDKGTLSYFDVIQPATSSSVASSSAKTGIKLLSNSKGPFTIAWSFSELVTLGNNKKWGENIADSNGNFTFAETTNATISATLTATTNQFKVPITFQDGVGHLLLSELQYVYDGQAPQLGNLNNITLWEQTKDTFFFTFTSTEPLAFARATTNGVTKNATGGPKHYRVDGLPLTVGENMIKISAQDAAGNSTSGEVKATMNPGAPKSTPFNFGSSQSLPANARHCTDEDKKICGYENVSDMSCEQFKPVRDCLQSRCSRSAFYLGDCKY